MSVTAPTEMRQIVDWRAAVWAGGVAGLVFLVFNLFITPFLAGGNAWVVLRLLASIVLGQGVLAPPATFDLTVLIVALLTHFILSLGFALLLAYILHRWGLIVGIVGGAILGLLLYAINFYTLTFFFPWFFAMRSWPVIVSHIIFGANAGGVY
jgi:hypothetical protein